MVCCLYWQRLSLKDKISFTVKSLSKSIKTYFDWFFRRSFNSPPLSHRKSQPGPWSFVSFLLKQDEVWVKMIQGAAQRNWISSWFVLAWVCFGNAFFPLAPRSRAGFCRSFKCYRLFPFVFLILSVTESLECWIFRRVIECKGRRRIGFRKEKGSWWLKRTGD